MVAKMTDGRMVEVVRVADRVGFSTERGWVNGRLLGIEHIKEHFGVEE
jgi:hypothetical protein